jgi:hypothetical protein
VRAYLSAFDHHRLSPLSKPLIRDAFNDVFVPSLEKLVAKGERLQKGGRVDELFRTLLENPDINRFDRKYREVSPLCLKWAAEIRANPDAFAKELAELPLQPRAMSRTADRPYVPYRMAALPYTPYRMIDVAVAAAQNKFTVISAFAGGGGSCTGYALAGGKGTHPNEVRVLGNEKQALLLIAFESMPVMFRKQEDCPISKEVRMFGNGDKFWLVFRFVSMLVLSNGNDDR